MSPRRWRPAVLLIAVALVAGCGDSGSRAEARRVHAGGAGRDRLRQAPGRSARHRDAVHDPRLPGLPARHPDARGRQPRARRAADRVHTGHGGGRGRHLDRRRGRLGRAPADPRRGPRDVADVVAGRHADRVRLGSRGRQPRPLRHRDRRQGLVRLTDSPGDEFSPAWSPDGATIAVTRSLDNRADIVLVDVAKRTEKRLASGQWASWMPDSRRLLVTEGPFAKGRLVARRHRSRGKQSAAGHRRPERPPGLALARRPDGGLLGVGERLRRRPERLERGALDGPDERRRRPAPPHRPAPATTTGRWRGPRTASRWCGRRTTRRAAPTSTSPAPTGKGVRRLTSDPGYDAWPSWAPHP